MLTVCLMISITLCNMVFLVLRSYLHTELTSSYEMHWIACILFLRQSECFFRPCRLCIHSNKLLNVCSHRQKHLFQWWINNIIPLGASKEMRTFSKWCLWWEQRIILNETNVKGVKKPQQNLTIAFPQFSCRRALFRARKMSAKNARRFFAASLPVCLFYRAHLAGKTMHRPAQQQKTCQSCAKNDYWNAAEASRDDESDCIKLITIVSLWLNNYFRLICLKSIIECGNNKLITRRLDNLRIRIWKISKGFIRRMCCLKIQMTNGCENSVE